MADQTAITHGTGGVTLTGDAIELFRIAQLKGFIALYAKTGIIPTRGVTIRRMLDMATANTGKRYKNSQTGYAEAAGDLQRWIDTMRAAIPHVKG